MTRLLLFVALLAAPLFTVDGQSIPAPTGHVNDFANVIRPDSKARMEDLATRVKAATAADIAVVTLPDLNGRAASDVALRIGREWRLGADSAIGSRYRNVGVVILVVPKETSSDGMGDCRIEVGQGAEGFITDAMSGSMCRAAVPLFRQQDYSGALEQLTNEVAGRISTEFGVTFDGVTPAPARQPSRVRGGGPSVFNTVLIVILVILVLSSLGGRRRRKSGCVGCLPIPVGGPIITGGDWHSRHGGWGGGGFGGGGFGGGGFGGFGGGGGFSGGGGGARW